MILLIDNYDSFTFNIVQYLQKLQYNVKIVRNDTITLDDIRALAPQAILLSPGPGTPNDAGISLDVVKIFATTIPIFGVCLGQQIIAQAFGASIVKAAAPMHGKTSVITHDGRGIFTNIKSPTIVGRYHSLTVTDLPNCLHASATTAQGDIQAIRHRTLPIEAVQFHPESILTVDGLRMIDNFFTLHLKGETV
ncbi:MAG: aminodeoxychorismate/anthranilate synthase component II [Caryophanon sp.]|nr:aminodeoxychorismate/anthranilate synthase component II [Caryophanon sp.]